MFRKKINQDGFAAIIVIVVALIMGGVGLGAYRVTSNDSTKQSVNRQAETAQISPLTPQDTALLADANELKKIDFDLDGVSNVQDADDDNDGIDDDTDTDDDNDGDEDNEDTEADEAVEAAELEGSDED